MCRLTLLALVAFVAPVKAQTLPLVDEVDWPTFREQAIALLAGLDKLGAALPADTTKAVRALLDQKAPANARRAGRAVQELLDAHCLVGVHVNPESRVKAQRGDRPATLSRDRPTYALVKVHNEGGVTHPLSVASEQAVVTKPGTERWVEMGVVNEKPFANRLTGQRVEYRVMKLVARQAGKREATLSFDVGQGTQDLGFRSELPILFTIREKDSAPGR